MDVTRLCTATDVDADADVRESSLESEGGFLPVRCSMDLRMMAVNAANASSGLLMESTAEAVCASSARRPTINVLILARGSVPWANDQALVQSG